MTELNAGVLSPWQMEDSSYMDSLVGLSNPEEKALNDRYNYVMSSATWNAEEAWRYAEYQAQQHGGTNQRGFATDMYNNMYESWNSNNAITRQFNDIRKAGLNPYILYQSGVGSGAPVPNAPSSGGSAGVGALILGLLAMLGRVAGSAIPNLNIMKKI